MSSAIDPTGIRAAFGPVHDYARECRHVPEPVVGRGYRVTQTARGYGLNGDGGFAYFDTERDLGVVVEAIEVPVARRPPILRQSGKIA